VDTGWAFDKEGRSRNRIHPAGSRSGGLHIADTTQKNAWARPNAEPTAGSAGTTPAAPPVIVRRPPPLPSARRHPPRVHSQLIAGGWARRVTSLGDASCPGASSNPGRPCHGPPVSPGQEFYIAPRAADCVTMGRALGQTIRRLSRQRTARLPLERIRPTAALGPQVPASNPAWIVARRSAQGRLWTNRWPAPGRVTTAGRTAPAARAAAPPGRPAPG
jgi:hypothetical protein